MLCNEHCKKVENQGKSRREKNFLCSCLQISVNSTERMNDSAYMQFAFRRKKQQANKRENDLFCTKRDMEELKIIGSFTIHTYVGNAF